MIYSKFLSGISPFWAITNAVARPLLTKKAWRAPCPVVSIGNVLAGGTGKTEIVSLVARLYISMGCRVTIATRGYGTLVKDPVLYSSFSEAMHGGAPDEVLVHLARAPGVHVVCSPSRAQALQQFYSQTQPHVILLDDGLQHFAIHRDLDIIVHDFSISHPIYRDFPALFERAKKSSSINSPVSLVCMGEKKPPSKWAHLPWAQAHYKTHGIYSVKKISDELAMSTLVSEGQPLLPRAILLSAIGNPSRFTKTVKSMGTEVVDTLNFSDHAPYNSTQLQQINNWANSSQNKGLPVLTTLKDGVKLASKLKEIHCDVNIVSISVEFTAGREKFESDLKSVISVGGK